MSNDNDLADTAECSHADVSFKASIPDQQRRFYLSCGTEVNYLHVALRDTNQGRPE
jgi:hypothetical protein